MILDGRAMSLALFGEALDPRAHLLRLYPALDGVVPPLSHVVGTASPLIASVNHGHWIASCPCGARGIPTPGCVVWMSGPGERLGWCARCQNGAVGRGWRPIVVPPPEERRMIEAVLDCRPNVEDRNWESSETLEDVIADNIAHGDPVPDVGEPPPTAVPVGPGPSRFPPAAMVAAVLARANPRRGLRRLLGR